MHVLYELLGWCIWCLCISDCFQASGYLLVCLQSAMSNKLVWVDVIVLWWQWSHCSVHLLLEWMLSWCIWYTHCSCGVWGGDSGCWDRWYILASFRIFTSGWCLVWSSVHQRLGCKGVQVWTLQKEDAWYITTGCPSQRSTVPRPSHSAWLVISNKEESWLGFAKFCAIHCLAVSMISVW